MELLITIHGIRTDGQWQARLRAMFTAASPSSNRAADYKFGFFDLG